MKREAEELRWGPGMWQMPNEIWLTTITALFLSSLTQKSYTNRKAGRLINGEGRWKVDVSCVSVRLRGRFIGWYVFSAVAFEFYLSAFF